MHYRARYLLTCMKKKLFCETLLWWDTLLFSGCPLRCPCGCSGYCGVPLEEEVWHCRDSDFPIAPQRSVPQRDTSFRTKRCPIGFLLVDSFVVCPDTVVNVQKSIKECTVLLIQRIGREACWLRSCLRWANPSLRRVLVVEKVPRSTWVVVQSPVLSEKI